ncbi:hypothetical protein FA13DRAFT_645786 [Coprinellus micaceus]|uniref:Uncharacterized protein n=1 Tax=Coprinellus micaceus TaxID=71717 RepID=A0A4Y7T5U1_COPMI|nr:hypothetical protein FA13DRAFT_645786 [Coprinellus micaceus]
MKLWGIWDHGRPELSVAVRELFQAGFLRHPRSSKPRHQGATHSSPTKSLWTARRPPYALILSRPGDHSYGSLDKPHLSFTGVLQTPRLPDAPSLDHSLERSGDLGTIRVAWRWTCGDSMFSPTLTPASDAKVSGAHLRGTIGLFAWLALCRFGGEIDILVHDLRQ